MFQWWPKTNTRKILSFWLHHCTTLHYNSICVPIPKGGTCTHPTLHDPSHVLVLLLKLDGIQIAKTATNRWRRMTMCLHQLGVWWVHNMHGCCFNASLVLFFNSYDKKHKKMIFLQNWEHFHRIRGWKDLSCATCWGAGNGEWGVAIADIEN